MLKYQIVHVHWGSWKESDSISMLEEHECKRDVVAAFRDKESALAWKRQEQYKLKWLLGKLELQELEDEQDAAFKEKTRNHSEKPLQTQV